MFADKGYEVVALDQRGFGFSEGTKGFIASPEQSRDDILEYTELVNQKFGGKDVPHFMVGHSLGGAICMFAAAERPELFSGMTLVAPFVKMTAKNQATLDKLKPMASLLNHFAPTFKLDSGLAKPPSWLEHWRLDPRD